MGPVVGIGTGTLPVILSIPHCVECNNPLDSLGMCADIPACKTHTAMVRIERDLES
jgi:hypothetical protein